MWNYDIQGDNDRRKNDYRIVVRHEMTGNLYGNSDKERKEKNLRTSDYNDYYYHMPNKAPHGHSNSAKYSAHLHNKVSLTQYPN